MEIIAIDTKEKQTINWIMATLIYILITMSLINANESIMTVAALASVVYVFFADTSSSLMLLVGITVFENSFKLSGNLAWFFLLAVILIKYFFRNGFYMFFPNKKVFLATVLLAILSFVTDSITYGIKGQMLTTVVLLIAFGIFFGIDSSKLNINARRIVLYLGTSFICAIIYVLFQYEGLSSFINSFMVSAYAYRFGLSAGDTIGGAMAIPLYSLLIISFSLYALFEEKNTTRLSNYAILLLDLVSIIVGAFTISRSFYSGMILIILIFLVSRLSNARVMRKKTILIIAIIVVCAIVFNLYSDIINRTLDSLFSRIALDETGGSGGRVRIWVSCISYLFSNPIGLLTGYGSNGYPIIGLKQGYLFSAGAHNLYLDIIMSWGLVGVACVLIIISQYWPKGGYINAIRQKTLAALPLLTLLMFCITAMRTNSMKTVIYFFCCFYILKKSVDTD